MCVHSSAETETLCSSCIFLLSKEQTKTQTLSRVQTICTHFTPLEFFAHGHLVIEAAQNSRQNSTPVLQTHTHTHTHTHKHTHTHIHTHTHTNTHTHAQTHTHTFKHTHTHTHMHTNNMWAHRSGFWLPLKVPLLAGHSRVPPAAPPLLPQLLL